MRLRHKPWAKEKLQQHPEVVIPNPEIHQGKWREFFNNRHPIHLEIGTGKGKFIVEMANIHRDINFIGLERQESVIVTALDRVLDEQLDNVILLQKDAGHLLSFFAENELTRIYLNFSDPWPKKRHEKRRLTHESFLKLYEHVLVNGGEIHFKTDNQAFFEYSLSSFSKYGMILKNISLHLHQSDFVGNVMTEYEEKFSRKGKPIFRCEAQFRSDAYSL